jgi:hypothetical protein
MAWSRTFIYMQKDLGMWLGVDLDYNNPDYTRFPQDVRKAIINQVRREISLRRDLRFFEATGTINAVDGDYDYALPSTWGRPYMMWRYDSNNNLVQLSNLTREEWRQKYDPDSSQEAAPDYYCIWGSNFLVTPTPDTSYTLYYDYYKLPADLSADSDTDEFLNEGWDAILFYSCARACDFLMEPQRRGAFDSRGERALHYLSAEHSHAQFSGRALQNYESVSLDEY